MIQRLTIGILFSLLIIAKSSLLAFLNFKNHVFAIACSFLHPSSHNNLYLEE